MSITDFVALSDRPERYPFMRLDDVVRMDLPILYKGYAILGARDPHHAGRAADDA